MPRTNEIRVKVNNSSRNFAPDSAKTVSYHKFVTEKNAKNKAYSFILSYGLLDDFAEFCKDYHSRDYHKDCLEFLLSNL